MSEPTLSWRRAILAEHRWLVYLLPLIVFMVVGSFEPPPLGQGNPDGLLPRIPYDFYPIIYTIKIALTVAAVIFVLPGYRGFPFRVSPLAVVVGVIGVVIWVGLCKLQLEIKLLGPLGIDKLLGLGTRSAYNPFEEMYARAAWCAWAFLAVRFFGLVVVVAVIEEFFLRGFVMRYVMDPAWWKVPFGRVNLTAALFGTLIPMLMHPGELLAAAVWFTMVTLLMIKTRNIWDCIVAHAITNLLLGIYVVTSGEWQLM